MTFLLANIPAFIVFLLLCLHKTHVKRLIRNIELEIDEKARSYNLLLNDYRKKTLLQESYYKKLKRFTSLGQIAKNIGFSFVPEEINRLIIKGTADTIENGDLFFLWEIDSDLKSLVLRAFENRTNISAPLSLKSDEFNLWTMRYRQPLLVLDLARDYRFNTREILSKTSIKSLISAPLITEDKIIGILRIDSQSPDGFSVDDLRLLVIIANISALAIQNSRLFKETEFLAIHDGLTNLYRKHYLEQYLETLLKESKDSGNSFCLLLIDLDRFKQLNDQYGHSAGDRVLQRVAEIIKRGAGQNSISSRYGGEEFGVLLPNTTKEAAKDIAEEIRGQVATEVFSIRREGVSITASIGVSSAPSDGSMRDEIIDKADKALYEAKRKGRNMVVSA